MATYLAPGVYIQEVDTVQPIEGVSTSVTGFVGVTQMGPLDTNPPVLVTSIADYQRTFGGYFNPQYSSTPPLGGVAGYNFLPHAVAGFFNNGGQVLYIKRAAASITSSSGALEWTAVAASIYNSATSVSNLENGAATPTLITTLLSTVQPGATTLQLASMLGIQNNTTLLLTQVKDGVTSTSGTLTVQSYSDAQKTVTLTVALPAPTPAVANYNWQYTAVAVTGGTPTTPADVALAPAPNTSAFLLQAANPGVWGNNIALDISPSSRTQAQVSSVGNATTTTTNDLIVLNSAANFYAGAILEFNTGTQKVYAKAKLVTGNGIQLWPAPSQTYGLTNAQVTEINTALGASTTVTVRTCEFDINASYGNVNESFRGLTLDNTTPYFYATVITNGSSLLSVPYVPASTPSTYPSDELTQDPSTMPMAPAPNTPAVQLLWGNDGAYPTALDFAGNDGGPGNRTGIAALIDAAEISIIATPGITDQTTQMALIDQCELLKYRFAILDPAPTSTGGSPAISDIQNQRNLYDTHYAAIYYPGVVVTDPLSGNPLTISPSGHVAGIYAQTDASRGVWKAPANVVINGILSLATKLSKGDQDVLNPEPSNINALRDFTAQGRGLRVYGARCITTDTEWMYVNIRRLFIYLEASLDQGTQWAVFEPNNQALWARLAQSVEAFLTTVWQAGGLMGVKATDAFFVKCDQTTMSLDDQENGRLIMQIGVAPVFPAEFVIIQIGQWQGGSSVQEL